ncbi:periplasmic polysaccharide export protein [Desulforapulum autotrophicum HRM2]|uniref:Periplasmic polysaccharide export protein n=1 Tax=Desulforapulum autotrophicum (strain ATCC 43914 / DSM 3382 / VKM B-1955 / HRM2) TaxID=177437 RepID=C0QCJ4_DESAH|nr:polysaccharide biosynthesis/export family protein [Desulforapulum autotrophicum]ACN15071.1 periplasmic polysaccharide export protein [Desulforapulum autotrophicum HRM2]
MSFNRGLFVVSLISMVIGCFFQPGISRGEAQETMEDYKIGAGDVFKIDVWKEPELSLEASVVRIDGKITFPLLDDLQASGLTTMDLKAVIEKRLSDFVEAPQVTVTLISPGSQRYYILGEVNETGEYPIGKKLTILQAFAIAKGFTEWASKKEIILFRRENGQERIIRVNYKDITKGDFSNNVFIQADDTIIVP